MADDSLVPIEPTNITFDILHTPEHNEDYNNPTMTSTVAEDQAHSPDCNLLKLPSELRLQIYELLYEKFTDECILFWFDRRHGDGSGVRSRMDWLKSTTTALLHTCRTINTEATGVFYDRLLVRMVAPMETRQGFRTTRDRLGKNMRRLEFSIHIEQVVKTVSDIDDVVAVLDLATSATLIDPLAVHLYDCSKPRGTERLRLFEQYKHEAGSRDIDLTAQTLAAKVWSAVLAKIEAYVERMAKFERLVKASR